MGRREPSDCELCRMLERLFVSEELATKMFDPTDLATQLGVPRVMSLEEYAELEGIAYQTAWSRAVEGRIDGAFKLGRQWRIAFHNYCVDCKCRPSHG